jgi:hypothetical protein
MGSSGFGVLSDEFEENEDEKKNPTSLDGVTRRDDEAY